MNKLAIALSAAVAVGASFSASAQSGTINIEGEVTSVTCVITWPGAGEAVNSPTVNMNKVPSSSLGTVGATAGKKAITLVISGSDAQCNSGVAALELNPNRDANQTAGYLNNLATGPDAATNVQIALRDAKDAPILVDTPWRSEEINLASIKQIDFAAEYRSLGATTPGQVTAAVNYTMDYK